jgi:hypothetical protein
VPREKKKLKPAVNYYHAENAIRIKIKNDMDTKIPMVPQVIPALALFKIGLLYGWSSTS